MNKLELVTDDYAGFEEWLDQTNPQGLTDDEWFQLELALATKTEENQ